ncbi:MAG: SulP family inorganic anion transporter [Bacteroidia bacterium]|nr:SulP family inorganic anion transporter [Bacteroidia bacterium]
MSKTSTAFLKSIPKNIFSGFVVSLIALPLGLGLALASEAPPISGIIAAVVGGIVVSLLGGSHVTITGPGNGLVIVLLGAITALGAGDMYQGYLFTLAAIVVSGALMLILGFLKLGRLSDFFPASAIQGMLAAIGVGILSKQFHIMIGNADAKGSIVSLLAQIPAGMWDVTKSMDSAIWAAAAVGVISLLIMVFYSKIRNPYFHLIPAPMWILILTVGFSYVCSWLTIPYPLSEKYLVNIPDNVLTNLAFPDFSKAFTQEFVVAVFAITFIASIESLLSIKALDKLDPENRRSNVNKDLKALGLASIISGFLGGLNVVTVIARSSVNVNNGATDRSANFFHGLILLALVLLFQEQLRRIPLAALAAILVYTGYKLASPELFRRIAGIGKEQFAIFLITFFTTIFTNLITGISVGILVTFIIHIIINKNIGLFIGNLFKPNILMFKEADEGNYYISVKYFSSFVNFYKLKNKLDAVPESETVVLDFSMVNFVDHTVMEGLQNYTDTFTKKGGSIEIIGLDKHDAVSVHPFAVRKILPFDPLKPIERYFTKRQSDLENTAADYHWSYRANKNIEVDFLSGFVFFRSREIRYFYNTLQDEHEVCKVLDVEFTEGEFIAKEVIKSTLMYITLERSLPIFTLDREGLLSFLYTGAGFREVIIPNHDYFNRRFHLSGQDREAVLLIFTDELILFLESHPFYHVESNGNAIMILKKERLLGVNEIRAMIYFGLELRALLQK